MNMKIMRSLSVAAIMALSMPSMASASEGIGNSNYTLSVELARARAVDNLVMRINNLDEMTEKYMLSTGDLTPTVGEVIAYYNYPNGIFQNYSNGSLTISLDGNVLTIGNVFGGGQPNESIARLYKNNPHMNAMAVINGNDLNKVQIPISAKLFNMIEVINQVSNNETSLINRVEPVDTTKIWYQPDGHGGFLIKKYDPTTASWKEIGNGNGADTDVIVSSEEELESLPKVVGSKATVSGADSAVEYIYNGEKWQPLGGEANGMNLFNGYASMTDIVGDLFNKSGSSKVQVNAPNGEWAGQKEFTKLDDTTNTNGWWQTSDVKFIILDTIENLDKVRNRVSEGTIAWIGDRGNALKLQLQNINGVLNWVYIDKGYDNDVKYLDKPHTGRSGYYVYDTEHNQHLKRINANNLQAIEGDKVNLVKGNRDNVSGVNGQFKYLTTLNDCSIVTCNGDNSHQYYGGSKIDNLYTYYYTTLGKRKNNLTDAKPYTNWNAIWDEALKIILWKGSNFGDIHTGDVLVKTTLNGHIAYKNVSTGKIVNKLNGLTIPNNYLPTGVYADTVKITIFNRRHYIELNDLNTFGMDREMPQYYPIYMNGQGFEGRNHYNHIIFKCSPTGTATLFSDNCRNISASHIVLTDGSRYDLPNAVGSKRINLTLEIDGPRGLPHGFSYPYNNTWKQWFYANGKGVHNMLDAEKIPLSYTSDAVDDYVHGLNRPFMLEDPFRRAYVFWKSWSDYTLPTHTRKYCKVSGNSIFGGYAWVREGGRYGSNRDKIASCPDYGPKTKYKLKHSYTPLYINQ